MRKKRLKANLPTIEGFSHIKYQTPALSGLTARVYAAFIGKPKRIIDVYDLLYCRDKKKTPNTGRISEATSQLLQINYLDLYQTETSNWPLLASNLLPLEEMFGAKRVRINESDRKSLHQLLMPDYEQAERFAISEDEASGKIEFIPSPLKMQTYLNSLATMALISLSKQQQPEFKEERELLRRIRQRTYGVTEEKKTEAQQPLSPKEIASDLALKARVSIKGGEEPRNIFLLKLIHLSTYPEIAENIEEEVFSLFE